MAEAAREERAAPPRRNTTETPRPFLDVADDERLATMYGWDFDARSAVQAARRQVPGTTPPPRTPAETIAASAPRQSRAVAGAAKADLASSHRARQGGTMPVILETLQRCPLFAGLSEPDLAALAEHCHLKKVSAGQALFTRGEPGTTMYVLASGSVRLTVSSARGDEVVLQVVTPPQAFGEMAVIDDGTRVATATAREAATVVAVPRASVQTLLRSRPGVAYAFLCGLVDLIREVDEHAVDLMLVDLRGRVAKAILTAVPVGSVPVGDSVDVDLRVHQGELAQRVGASRQHVNRALAALAADGAITRSGAHVTRVRPDLLAAAAAR